MNWRKVKFKYIDSGLPGRNTLLYNFIRTSATAPPYEQMGVMALYPGSIRNVKDCAELRDANTELLGQWDMVPMNGGMFIRICVDPMETALIILKLQELGATELGGGFDV